MPFIIKCENKNYPIKIGINMIGRRKDNDIRVEDSYVSRRHLSIDLVSDGTMTLLDLGSKNGLIVNGKKVSSAILRTGNKFIIGTTQFLVKKDNS